MAGGRVWGTSSSVARSSAPAPEDPAFGVGVEVEGLGLKVHSFELWA
jgi:hypothetical protein